jgi:hypothetical protein
MHPGPQPHPDDTVFLILLGLALLIAAIVYIIPTIVAFRRNHPNRWVILVINVAFGGTVVGWGIALVWAMRAAHRGSSTGSGGESGLNLFINDVKKIQLVEPPPIPQVTAVQELELDRLTRHLRQVDRVVRSENSGCGWRVSGARLGRVGGGSGKDPRGEPERAFALRQRRTAAKRLRPNTLDHSDRPNGGIMDARRSRARSSQKLLIFGPGSLHPFLDILVD